MRGRPLPSINMRALSTNPNRATEEVRQLTLPSLALAAFLALILSGCTTVATYTQPTLVRVIDASYIAPAINVYVEGTLLAGNIGQGTITPYGTLAASTAAPIKITAATATTALTSTSGTLLAALFLLRFLYLGAG